MELGKEEFRGKRIGMGIGWSEVDIKENEEREMIWREGRNRR